MLILFYNNYLAKLLIYFSMNAVFYLQKVIIPCALDFSSSFFYSANFTSLSLFISVCKILFLKILFSETNCYKYALCSLTKFCPWNVKCFTYCSFSFKRNFVYYRLTIIFVISSKYPFLARFMSYWAMAVYLFLIFSTSANLLFSRPTNWFLNPSFSSLKWSIFLS